MLYSDLLKQNTIPIFIPIPIYISINNKQILSLVGWLVRVAEGLSA